MQTNTIICGDCLEVMKDWPDNCVDLVLTDPPYGIGLEYADYNDTEANWYILMMKLLPECKRLSSMSIMPTCRIKALEWIYTHIPPDWLICWYKGSPGHRSFVGFNDWEPLMVYGKNQGVQMHDYFYCQPEGGSGTTCVAAKMLGRRYIGIDISEEYCEIARMRLKAVETGVPVAEQKQGQKGLWE